MIMTLDGGAPHKLRYVAADPRRFCDDHPLYASEPIEHPQRCAATGAQHDTIDVEETIETVVDRRRHHRIETPPALVTLEMRAIAQVEAETRRISENLDQRRRIAQRQIDTLPGNRMNAVRRIADKREAAGDQPARQFDVERPRLRAPNELDRPEPAADASIELGKKAPIV